MKPASVRGKGGRLQRSGSMRLIVMSLLRRRLAERSSPGRQCADACQAPSFLIFSAATRNSTHSGAGEKEF